MGLEEAIPVDGYLTTQVSRVINWARRSSVWPMPFATACCGIELMATASSRFDLARFGAEVFRFSPRQADLMIVAGRISVKMMPVLQRVYIQMAEPKWVISMGACASTGGVFDTYAVVQGVDPVHACRRVCSGVPSSAGNADRWLNGNSTNYRRRQHPLRWRWETYASGSQSSFNKSKFVFANRCNYQRFEHVKFKNSTTTIGLSATNTHGMMSA